MQLKRFFFVLTICFILCSCGSDNRKSFSISIEYSSPWSYPINYLLTENSVIVSGVKKQKGGRMEPIYRRKLTKSESDSIYNFIASLKYDTLKERYVNEHFFDGTAIVFKIAGQGLVTKKVIVYMRSTVITDTLEKLVEGQILNNKFKWSNL